MNGSNTLLHDFEQLLPRVAASTTTVLLLGETGSGKSFYARRIHDAGPRAAEPFRELNCSAIPENLVESELFGHERGSFSGAVASRAGAFEAAGTGTIFLDEIGELPLASQAKLLRVLDERRYERVGSNHTLAVRARIIAATNRDLRAMVQEGAFRKDLYFRLDVCSVRVPSLRERRADVIPLAQRFLAELARSAGRSVHGFSDAALASLERHDWPGNIRELRSAIERSLLMAVGDVVEAADLALPFRESTNAAAQTTPAVLTLELPMPLADIERRAVEATFAVCQGNHSRAAALLGIDRETLYRKRRAWGIAR
jgi:DNA-binding NtrC family response regulator